MKEATRIRREAEQRDRIAAHVQKVVDAAPPLTVEQRDRLALLLSPRLHDLDDVIAEFGIDLDDDPIEPTGGDALSEMMEAE